MNATLTLIAGLGGRERSGGVVTESEAPTQTRESSYRKRNHLSVSSNTCSRLGGQLFGAAFEVVVLCGLHSVRLQLRWSMHNMTRSRTISLYSVENTWLPAWACPFICSETRGDAPITASLGTSGHSYYVLNMMMSNKRTKINATIVIVLPVRSILFFHQRQARRRSLTGRLRTSNEPPKQLDLATVY